MMKVWGMKRWNIANGSTAGYLESSIVFLRELPYRVDFSEHGKRISVMHYCMNQAKQYINYTPHPNKSSLLSLFPDMEQDVVIYGHDHTRTICQSENKWFVNSGSLGCPAHERNIARAAILEITETSHVFVQSIEVQYDVFKVLKDIDQLAYPASEEIKRFFFGV